MIHTVKGFGVVNKAEVDAFLELSCFFYDPVDVDNLNFGSSAFSKPSLYIWKFLVTDCWSLAWRIWSITFSSVQLLSRVRLFATPWIAARQASLSITNSWSSLKLTSIESVMPSSHLILCHPLLLLPPIPPSISLFQWVNSSYEVAKVLEFQL